MASFNKVNQFTKDLIEGVHNFTTGAFKVVLTNTAPTATSATLSTITQISNGNGYTTGGSSTTITTSTSSGTAKVVGTDVVFTASGAVGPFQYAVLYNDTPTSPADPVVGYWNYGSAVTMASGDTFTVDFDGTNGIFTIV